MGSLDEFLRSVCIPFRRVGGLTLIQGADAPSLIDALSSAGIRILGVEGFEVEGSEVRPDMGLIADFSGVTDPKRSALEARHFIRAVARDDALFEFSIAGE